MPKEELVSRSLDNVITPIYGILVAFWGLIMLTTWERTQKKIQFIWGCSDNAFSSIDENQDFRYSEKKNKGQ